MDNNYNYSVCFLIMIYKLLKFAFSRFIDVHSSILIVCTLVTISFNVKV